MENPVFSPSLLPWIAHTRGKIIHERLNYREEAAEWAQINGSEPAAASQRKAGTSVFVHVDGVLNAHTEQITNYS